MPEPAAANGNRLAPALWRQLQLASAMVQAVQVGRSLTAELDRVDRGLRPGVQALSFHALRWLGSAEVLVGRLAKRRPPPGVHALLCTSLALLMPPGASAYSEFTLVDQTVEAAKRNRASRAQPSMVNACLRRYLRERDAWRGGLGDDALARWSHPPWWIERLQRDHPGDWQAVLAAAQVPAPMVLRVNVGRTTGQAFASALARAGIAAVTSGETVRLVDPRPVEDIPGFAAGWVSVQSASAQLAAPLLLSGLDIPQPRVLDACAAPGGKTAHLLELRPDARVTALEIDPTRSARIEANLVRLGLRARVRVADAADTDQWWTGEQYDAILLDAPCSASGIVSRHPDVRWLRRPSDIAQLAAQQDRLLDALWPVLAPGGRLLYCTCSVFREEGVERIQAFVARNTDACSLTSPGHILPSTQGTGVAVGDNVLRDDGFYYALLEKRST